MSPPAARRPEAAALLHLAWPIVLSRATQSVVGFADAVMVAPLGDVAVAAVTTGALDLFCAVMLPLGTVAIVQSFAAQLRGKGDLAAAYRHAHHGLLLSLLASLPFLAGIPFLDRAVAAIGVTPEVQAPMAEYLAVRALSVPAMLGLEALGGWYGGLGNTRVALLGGLLTMLANLAGNALLILPRFGLPGYGVSGAAWASTAASWVGFVVVLATFRRGIGHDLPRAPFAFVGEELRRVLRFGLPSGLNYFVEFTAFVAFINVVVGHLGTPALAAFNIVLQVNSVSFMPAIGVASAGAILCGEAIGRGDREAVPAIVRLTLRVTTAWMLAMAAVYLLAPRAILSLFDGGGVASRAMLETGATMLALSALWQLFDAIAMTHGEALRAAGDTAWPMWARILLAWAAFTPLAWAAVFLGGGGVVTVMVSVILYLGVLAVLLTLRFRSGRWRAVTLVGP